MTAVVTPTEDVTPEDTARAPQRLEQQDPSGNPWIQPVPDLIDPLGITGSLAGQWMYLPAVGAAGRATTAQPGKVVILDPKPKVAPISMGYQTAFRELYPDIITHVPNARVQELDPFKKRIKTTAGEFDFDDAILMPPHQAADMVWHAGLIGTDAQGKPTGWADMHPRLFHANSDDSVYFVGDLMGAISPQFGHYPKSGHVANYVGRIVAQNLAERISGKEIIARLPDNLCYMMVNIEPMEEISVKFEYELDPKGMVVQTQIDVDVRTADMVQEDFAWARDRFSDFLAI